VKAVQIGCDIESSEKALSLAKRYPGVLYPTIGCHPEHAQHFTREAAERDLGILESILVENREDIIAIGECGLDYHYLTENREEEISIQKYVWKVQGEWGEKYDLPLIIHTRDAREDTLRFMREHSITRCVMHCFSEDWDFARELLDFSSEIYFSFSGIVTYKKSEHIQEAAKNIPLNRILIETDAPFLAPQPVRGSVNEPANTLYNLEKIAELRGVSVNEIEDVIYENSMRFYGIKN
jgi:TatD DNase family protein